MGLTLDAGSLIMFDYAEAMLVNCAPPKGLTHYPCDYLSSQGLACMTDQDGGNEETLHLDLIS